MVPLSFFLRVVKSLNQNVRQDRTLWDLHNIIALQLRDLSLNRSFAIHARLGKFFSVQ